MRFVRFVGMPVRFALVLAMWLTLGVTCVVIDLLFFPENISSGKVWDFFYVLPMEWVRG